MRKDEIPRGEYKDRYITLKEVVRLLNCSRGSIYKWIKEGVFPPGIRLGLGTGIRRWSEAEIHEFARSRSIQRQTSQESGKG